MLPTRRSRALADREVLRRSNVGTDTLFPVAHALSGTLENKRIVQSSFAHHNCVGVRFLKAGLDVEMVLLFGCDPSKH